MAVTSLYLHIPFCRARCSYCDFETRAVCGSQLFAQGDRYARDLLERLRRASALGALDRIETVYIGGGTPTVLGERLLDIVHAVRAACDPVEFTCEANPESFTDAMASGLTQAGVTRISLGVQSLDDDELALLGRIHSSSQAQRAVERAIAHGFSTSIDLICGLPGQSMDSWNRTLTRACALGTDHVSVYPLMIEDGTPLCRAIDAGELEEPDEDLQAAMMDAARDVFLGSGLEHYEVASYARPGKVCRHNIAYWTGRSYLGLGRSAASMLSARDFAACRELFGSQGTQAPASGRGDASSNDFMVDDVPGDAARIRLVQLDDRGERFEGECLTAREAAAEDLMLAARMSRGISYGLVRRACDAIGREALAGALGQAADLGLLRVVGSWDAVACATGDKGDPAEPFAVPTQLGWLMGNQLYGLLWDLHND